MTTNICPVHKRKLRISKWIPYDGLDPKMKRYACIECADYWYKAPKSKFKRMKEIIK